MSAGETEGYSRSNYPIQPADSASLKQHNTAVKSGSSVPPGTPGF